MNSIKFLASLLLVLLAAGCGGGGSGGGGKTAAAPRVLTTIAVSPGTASISAGASQQFTATGTFSDGSTEDISTSAGWSSSDQAVAAIDGTGLATAAKAGVTTITASSAGISGSSTLTVAEPVLSSITVTPANHTVAMNDTLQLTATGTYSDQTTKDITQAVTWSSSAASVATVGSAAGSFGKITPVAPGDAVISASSGNIAGSTSLTVAEVSTAANVVPITVNGALCSADSYPNKPCVAITVCIPGTNTCKTISDILLDTGSFGVRLFKQPLGLDLPAAPGTSGNLAECIQFADGTSEWGPIRMAEVILGNEARVQVPIHVFDRSFGSPPTECANADPDPATAGFNGILGVGLFAQDCGVRCTTGASNGMYFSCSGTSCTGTTVAVADQVKNPVASLPQNNNGVLVRLPAVPPEGAQSVNGEMLLGIGTQANNSPEGINTFHVNQFGEITTIVNGISTGSFIDSGSNGLFFTPPAQPPLPSCAPPFAAWFCPDADVSIVATTVGATGAPTVQVPFRIGNFQGLTATGNRVFDDIGGPSFGSVFDWGLPFFLGRNVIIGIEGKETTLGNGPFWAY